MRSKNKTHNKLVTLKVAVMGVYIDKIILGNNLTFSICLASQIRMSAFIDYLYAKHFLLFIPNFHNNPFKFLLLSSFVLGLVINYITPW